jgi:hypothetical protein
MDDFRRDLSALVDEMLAAGYEPMFLVIDLVGAEVLRQSQDLESLERFRDTCMGVLSGAAGNVPTFSHGDVRIIGVLPGFDRLKTFALIEKMRRALPLQAQSYDCVVTPEFETIEYDSVNGVPGVYNQLIAPRRQLDAA